MACHSRFSHRSRVFKSVDARAMRGINSLRVLLTAPLRAPDEVSMCSKAGQILSTRPTTPSAASTGSRRATSRISDAASFRHSIASREARQPQGLGTYALFEVPLVSSRLHHTDALHWPVRD